MSDDAPALTKRGKPRKKMGGPKKPTATRKVSVLKLRVTEEYEEWVKKVADHMGIDISTLLDMGVTKVARDIRFPIPPPPR